MNEAMAIAGLITAVSAAAVVIFKILHTINCVMEGLRCQLRTEMLRTYYRHKDDKKIRQYEKENFKHNFDAYKALGGNSFIDDINGEVTKWEVIS